MKKLFYFIFLLVINCGAKVICVYCAGKLFSFYSFQLKQIAKILKKVVMEILSKSSKITDFIGAIFLSFDVNKIVFTS